MTYDLAAYEARRAELAIQGKRATIAEICPVHYKPMVIEGGEMMGRDTFAASCGCATDILAVALLESHGIPWFWQSGALVLSE